MKVRSIVLSTLLMISVLPIHAAVSADTFPIQYQHTTMLMLEADLRLHLCHLKEFSQTLLVPAPETTIETNSRTHVGSLGNTLANEQEHAFNETLLCRKEAEDAIKAKLVEAEQELSQRPVPQEKLKGLVAAWLAAMKVIPRTMLSKEALLSQQDEDRKALRQRQSELEVELFWSLDQPRGWASRRPPSN
jgi:hypothetical protein